MKKIISIVLLLCFLVVPNLTKAMYYVRTFNLKIIKNTIGGEGSFDFSAYERYGTGYYYQPGYQAQITTISGRGEAQNPFLLLNDYKLIESWQPGWNLTGVSCSSNNPLSVFTTLSYASEIYGVEMSNVSDLDSVVCTFTNSKAAQGKTPVLIVPGILGTEIFKGDEKLWLNSLKMLPPSSTDVFMDPLAYKEDGSPLYTSLTLGDVLGKPGKVLDYSDALITDLVNKGYINNGNDPKQNLFTFPYDWRKDLDDVAKQNLKGQIDYILNQTDAGKSTGKIDIIAHSQGGLVVKRLLSEIPEYKSKIDKLVFVGVPNLGAPKAAKALVYGDNLDVSFLNLGLDYLEVRACLKTPMSSI